MVAERSDSSWIIHRRSFLKAYLFLFILILGLILAIYCSWTEKSDHKSYPIKPKYIFSEELLSSSADNSIIRILHESNGDFNILTNNLNGTNEDITLINYNSEGKNRWQTNFGGLMKDYGSSVVIDPQENILAQNPDAICIELPIWYQSENGILAGHVDLIMIIDGIMYVCDYKPDHGFDEDATVWRKHFLSCIPQLCAYGLISKKIFNIDKLYCLSFSKDAEWIYDATPTLAQVNNYLKGKGYNNYELWDKYLPKL